MINRAGGLRRGTPTQRFEELNVSGSAAAADIAAYEAALIRRIAKDLARQLTGRETPSQQRSARAGPKLQAGWGAQEVQTGNGGFESDVKFVGSRRFDESMKVVSR